MQKIEVRDIKNVHTSTWGCAWLAIFAFVKIWMKMLVEQEMVIDPNVTCTLLGMDFGTFQSKEVLHNGLGKLGFSWQNLGGPSTRPGP